MFSKSSPTPIVQEQSIASKFTIWVQPVKLIPADFKAMILALMGMVSMSSKSRFMDTQPIIKTNKYSIGIPLPVILMDRPITQVSSLCSSFQKSQKV
ncbi:unnamed protein product [Cuscuta campestris]|uniref:Uncharacterized protein n=1 Tax=Cuscuta campestris TaxID=132261 RepID=A0A484NCH1_9ASTE|nr:unnamed protein product [Cuscuta campestris]